jgi:hypothetical protein
VADLVGAIENLKKLLQQKQKRKSSSITEQLATEKKPRKDSQEYNQEWEYKPASSWMTKLEYYPLNMANVRSGAVVMFVRANKGNPNGYIYPRVPFVNFMKWINANARGGRIYWYGVGTPALKDYSVATRTGPRGQRIVKGRIGRTMVSRKKQYFPARSKASKFYRMATKRK